MAYNKAKEERKWRLWKEAEEKKLRSLGVSEDAIEQLHIHDWAVFNSDRRYYQRLQDAGTYLEEIAEQDQKVISFYALTNSKLWRNFCRKSRAFLTKILL